MLVVTTLRGRWPGLLVAIVLLISALALNLLPAATASTAAPLLLITDPSAPNRFGPYLAEMLHAEGFMAFDQRDIAIVDAATLQPYPLMLLAEMPLTPTQAALFASYAAAAAT